MNYRIYSLYKLIVEPRTYFVDANVWLFHLVDLYLAEFSITMLKQLDNYKKGYVTKMEELLGNPETRLAFNPLLASEIVNAFIRKYAMKAYLLESGWKEEEIKAKAQFKDHYRETQYGSEHFRQSVRFVVDNLSSYIESERFELSNAGFDNNELAYYLIYNFKTSPASDFNDYYYYELCLGNRPEAERWPIITDDSDFCFEGVEVYTMNTKLLRRSASA